MKNEDAVSPVVGVMLMLVVTIIIAAVVSGFAGGLVDSTESAPSVTMDVQIKNGGLYGTSSFIASVLSVSEPIPTSDLKLTTRWTAYNKSDDSDDPETITHVTFSDGSQNVFGWLPGIMLNQGQAPWGYGTGVISVNSGVPNEVAQQYGNYALSAGTVMKAYPAGQSGGFSYDAGDSGYGVSTQYEYTNWDYTAGTTVDGMQAILGKEWENLRTGDVVTVTLTHVPTGRNIYSKDVVVG
jgi:archaeal type IV pilus assembly protein PilA